MIVNMIFTCRPVHSEHTNTAAYNFEPTVIFLLVTSHQRVIFGVWEPK